MCGIVGAIVKGTSGFTKKTEDSFLDLLYVDALRGLDSTGVIAIDKWGGFATLKEASQSSVFLPKLKDHKVFKEMWSGGKIWVGHNRKKTIGEVKDETAHPFTVDKTFAMVHNGTIHSYKHLDDKAQTDSQALATVLHKALSQEDYIKALNEELGRVYGAYALAFFSQTRNKFYLLRNKERPLSIIETEDAYIFASEAQMAYWLLTRNGYEHDKLKIKNVAEHTLYSFDLTTNQWNTENIEPKKATAVATKATATVHGTTTSTSGIVVSKQAFKFIKRKLLGSRAYFWINDYVEEDYPKTIEEGATSVLVMGSDDDIKWCHDICTVIDLSDHGILTSDELFEVKWCGVIDDVKWNENLQSVSISLKDCQPLPKAAPNALKELWSKSLEHKTLITLKKEYKENKYKYTDWQVSALEEEIRKREKEVNALQDALMLSNMKALQDGLELVLKEANEKGVKVVKEKRGDLWTWFNDDTDEVLYESSIALH